MLSRLLFASVLPLALSLPALAQDVAAPAAPAARPVPRPVVRSAPVVRPVSRPVVRSAPVERPAPRPYVQAAPSAPNPVVRNAPAPERYVQRPKPVQPAVIARPTAPSRQVAPTRTPVIVQRPPEQNRSVAQSPRRNTPPPTRTVRVARPPAAIATAAKQKAGGWQLSAPAPRQPQLIAAAPVSRGLTPATAPVFAATPYQQAQGSSPLQYLLPKAGGMIFPLAIPAQISSVFGWRTHPISGEHKFHSGTDIAAPMGTPVVATYAGRVQMAGYYGGYGLTVLLHHQGDRASRYAHLSEIFVQPGQRVEQGKVIGLVGSTGYSTGPHLHYEALKRTAGGYELMDPSVDVKLALSALVEASKLAGMPQQALVPKQAGPHLPALSGSANAGVKLMGTEVQLIARLF